MKWRRRRGTWLQELGKAVGGVLALFGTVAFLKANGPQPTATGSTFRAVVLAGSGDLFTPFPAEHLAYVKWIGAALALGGMLLRIRSYWYLFEKEGTREEEV